MLITLFFSFSVVIYFTVRATHKVKQSLLSVTTVFWGVYDNKRLDFTV